MKLCKIFNHRLLLAVCNLLFMSCGISLLTIGFYLFSDAQRILLSRLVISSLDYSPLIDLPQPIFFYVALGIIFAGLLITLAAALGLWAVCINRFCILSVYFLLVILLLLFEFSICLGITVWPQCLGLTLNITEMVRTVQEYYGISGEEQFTAAMDLAQVKFECCGVNGSFNYENSVWKLEGLGKKELTVPLTCCHLQNKYDKFSYLDPVPVNNTFCQAINERDHEGYRYTEGCADRVEQWYREQFIYFLSAGVGLALIEFIVLLSIIFSCTKLSRNRVRAKTLDEIEVREPPQTLNHLYQQDGMGTILPEIREVFIQPQSLQKKKHSTSFKPHYNNYEVSRSYLV